MNSSALRMLAGLALLSASMTGMAAEITFSASFAPSMSNPENNAFTNTTPIDGICVSWPQTCVSKNVISIALPLTAKNTKPIASGGNVRDGVFFKIPRTPRNITIRNVQAGTTASVSLYFDFFGAKMAPAPSNTSGTGWENGTMYWSSGKDGCTSGAISFYTSFHLFAWSYKNINSENGCYKVSNIERSVLYEYTEMMVGYTLVTPNPLNLQSGIYEGSVNFTVGPGGDFDFGDNAQASDTQLTANFILSINHELKLTTTADDQKVSLQPCAPGRVCTEDEGQANWERWMVTRVTPFLTGRSGFSISSSGSFTTYLQCEYEIEGGCGLKSDNSTQLVPVQTMLTLPDNIVDAKTGSGVIKRTLKIGRDILENVYHTKSFGQNRSGYIDFQVTQRNVDTMLNTRPDTYRGAVTVIFDSSIY